MFEHVRNLFPVLKKYVYLNCAAAAPIPATTVSAVRSQLDDVAQHGVGHYNQWIATKNRARSLLAEMLGVQAEEVAFMRNTSDGFAAIANGIDWRDGDNIVSYAGEFPSNFYPWRMVRDRYGTELRLCGERDGRMDEDELVSMIDRNTRLVSVSAVQFATGFRCDLERIGRAARDAGAIFAVDVIQGLGQFGFDLPSQYVDIASGASHKWLCAPEGCGFLYVSPRVRDQIEPALVGWISVQTPWDFDDREQPFKPNALAWESGTGPSSLFYGLEASLMLLNECGLERIERHLENLTNMLCDSLQGSDYEIVSSRKPGERSAIVCIKNLNGLDCEKIADILAERNVIVSPRQGSVRIAPHFFNERSDIEALVEALP
ncbi:MAG TPA: aminotransferase class V-fold PLP-dependent enzyme [Pyrinomonadaceae bacterium]|nr:aminotransferase class V-fold PLP-dependent enzyme [Pyrinomonadaceae bacterium]